MIVYMLRNTTNGKCYIGRTSGALERRLQAHRCVAARSAQRTPIRDAILADGPDAFEAVELEHCRSEAHLREREAAWIAELNTTVPNGYNVRVGESGWRHTAEAKAKMQGRPTWNKGVPRTAEEKRKMSEAKRASARTRRRAIVFRDVMYPSVLAAMRAHNLNGPVMYRLIREGRARYVTP